MSLSLSFSEADQEADDLVLTVGDQAFPYSSFWLVPKAPSPQERAADVRAHLVSLLEQWSEAVHQLREGELVYLPYEWEDDCLGCIQCRCLGADCELVVGTLPFSMFDCPHISTFTTPMMDKSQEPPPEFDPTLEEIPDPQGRGRRVFRQAPVPAEEIVRGPVNHFWPLVHPPAVPVRLSVGEILRGIQSSVRSLHEASS